MKRSLSLLLAVLLVTLAFAGCGNSDDTDNDANTSEGSDFDFSVALSSDIASLDPSYAHDFATNSVVNQITEGLLGFDENNQIVPLLAADWQMTDDTTYVYTIRSDVNFSNGTPMTMDDVLFSLNRTMTDTSYLRWMYAAVASIEQTGDWELTVRLKQPSVNWQYVLATAAGHIISKDFYEANPDRFGDAEVGVLGTGPFVYDRWNRGQEIILQRNENYWNKDVQVDIRTLTFNIIADDTDRATALQTGQVHFTAEMPPDKLNALMEDDSLTVTSTESFGVSYLAFNTQKAPFNEVNVRKAVYHAINMDAIQQNIVRAAGSPASVIPHGPALYTIEPDRWESYAADALTYTYNVDLAREYLEQSSVPEGFSCRMLLDESSLSYSKALAIQEFLKAIDIDCTIVRLNADEHADYQLGGHMTNGIRDYDMILAEGESDYPDISGNMAPLYLAENAGAGGANAAAYVNETVDDLLQRSLASINPTERNDLTFQALDMITDEIPYIFIEYPTKHSVLNNGYTGFSMNASCMWNMRFMNIHAV